MYDIILNKKNHKLKYANILNNRINNKLNKEIKIFREEILYETDKINKYRNNIKHIQPENNDKFRLCKNKKILIINLYADLLRDHYNSGKVTEWYKKLTEYNNCLIPSFESISSIEIPYTFGNGINETKFNNFFETLDYIKQKIDNHKEEYDIALISSGIYTAFIADYIGNKNKSFICFGRGINNIFCIKYKDTYTWCQCQFTKNYIEPYLCSIPEKYKLNNYKYIEDGCYW